MVEIREYGDGGDVEITEAELDEYGTRSTEFKQGDKRFVIIATNEGGHNNTLVDLLDVIAWVKENKPELLKGGICSTCKFWYAKDKFPESSDVGARACELDVCDLGEMEDDHAATICGHDGGIYYGPKYGCIHWEKMEAKVKDDKDTDTETD